MPSKKIPLAIAYDFDGTLAPGNMQERDFIPAIKMTKKKFWDEVKKETELRRADNILVYMNLMLEKARAAQVKVRLEDFMNYGKSLQFFEGILPYRAKVAGKFREINGWFDRINTYGTESGVTVQHYVVSSGIREMVAGSPIAKKFKAIFASSFWYDHHGIATWPALALNYTTKTQFLFRINKGCLDVYDEKVINRYVPEAERPVPFSQMVYVGDGDTDIPCFRLVKDRGGHSIAAYKPFTRGAKEKSERLVKDGRVNFVVPADYSEGSRLDVVIKAIIDKIAHDQHVVRLKA